MTGTLKVLVIEDEEADFMLLEEALRAGGIDSSCTRVSEDAALDKALALLPDLILSDYNVPGMSLANSMVRIRNCDATVPVILVSGSVTDAIVVDLLYLGITDFVPKNGLIRLMPAVKRAQENRSQSLARRKADSLIRRQAKIITETPANVIMTDLQGIVTFWNHGAEELLGYPAAEAVGRHIGFIYFEEDLEILRSDVMAQLFRLGSLSLESRVRRKSGEERYQLLSLALTYDDNQEPDGMIGYGVDITKSRQVEASNLLLSEALRQSKTPILLADADTNITYFNPAFGTLFGYEPSELYGGSIRKILPHVGDCSSGPVDMDRHIAESGESIRDCDRICKDGTIIPVSAHIGQIRGAGGALLGYVAGYYDLRPVRAAESKFRIALDLSPNAVFIIAPDGHFTYVNERAIALVGYTRAELLTMGILDLKTPDQVTVGMSAFARILAGHYEFFETTLLHSSGRRLEVEFSGVLLPDGTVLKELRDITAQKENAKRIEITDAALSALNRHLEELVADRTSQLTLATDSAQIGIWDYNVANNTITWSKWMYGMYGVRQEDFGGVYQAWRDGLHPEDLARADAEIEQALSGEKEFDTEFRVVWPNGDIRHIKANALVQRDAGGVALRMIGVNYDITERKRGDAKLFEQQQFLRTVTDSIPSMIGYWGRDLRCRFANKTYEKWFDVTVETVVGKHMREVLGEQLFLQNQFEIQGALNGKVQVFDREIARVDGTIGYMKARYLPDLSEGMVQGFFVLIEDVTELTIAEKTLRLLNAELGVQVAAAKQASVAKTNFLANMSHEIRSPLNGILGLAYLLEQSQLDSDSRVMVQRIRSSGRMLLGIVSDILDVSKIETGQMELEHAPFDLTAVIDNVASATGVAIGEKDIKLIVGPVPKGATRIVGDALRLEQVLINLCSNAVKFTPSGRIELRMEVASSADAGDLLRFRVQDSGIGIASEMQEGIFSAFSQADTSTTRRFGGTGLGLTICRQLVGLMGGGIGVTSEPGKGSEFWFTVPLHHADDSLFADDRALTLDSIKVGDYAGSARRQVHHQGGRLAGMRVLVVDDSDINRDVAQRILEGVGASVALAGDGQEAIDWLLTHPFEVDLVLMDVQMPVLDGIEATRRLRRVPQFDDLPIVALTAGAFKSQRSAAMEAGMTHFVSKPFDIDATIDLLQRLRRPSTVVPAQLELSVRSSEQLSVEPAPPDGTASTGVIDVAQGLRLWSDAAVYKSYLRRFAHDYADAIERLRTSMLARDSDGAAALAHKLSGVAANLALIDVRKAAHRLGCVVATPDKAAPALMALAMAMESTIAEIHRYAPPLMPVAVEQSPVLTSEKRTELLQALGALLEVLDSDNAGQVKKVLAGLPKWLPAYDLSVIFSCVVAYDFRGAEAATRNLVRVYTVVAKD